MPFHDEYARRTPFDFSFPEGETADELAREVRAEAEARGADLQDWGAFNMLASVAGFLKEFREPDAPPEAFMDYGALIYHAHHFMEAGAPLYLVSTHAARYLVDGGPAVESVEVPAHAGYVQLPRHLFWIDAEGEDSPAEAVDGFFWFLGDDGLLRLLSAMGMRDGRPGLGVVRLPEVPFADAATWLHVDIRREGKDFSTTLPGGEMEGLYSFTTSGEVLKFVGRLFAYLGHVPEASGEVVAAEPRAEGQPEPSSLSYRRVLLHA